MTCKRSQNPIVSTSYYLRDLEGERNVSQTKEPMLSLWNMFSKPYYGSMNALAKLDLLR